MGAWYDDLSNEEHRAWINEQKIFWVATAPLSNQGHVNVSPKGRPSFNLVGNSSCWYSDMTGSGNETLSHLYEPGNGRITIMFSAFEGPARILRLFGHGRVFERDSKEFKALLPDGDERILPGTRAIIWVDFHKVSTSCGFAVPYFSYEGERLELDTYYTKLQSNSDLDERTGIASKLLEYWSKKNSLSVDTMPGLKLGTDLSIALQPPFETYGSYKDGKVAPSGQTRTQSAKRDSRGVDLSIVLALLIAFVSGLVLAPRVQAALAAIRTLK